MIRMTAKIKLAAGLAAGALTLGAAGAYAAANNPITVDPTKSFTLGSGTNTLKLVPLNGATTLSLPTGGFKDPGQCVSWLATNRNYALAPSGSSTKVSKNYHGKLMSAANEWCKTQLTTTKDRADNDGSDATDSAADATDSGDLSSGGSHGHGHGRGERSQ